MSVVNDRMAEVIQNQPDDATYEEILREFSFEQMIEAGLHDSMEGKAISNQDMKPRLNEWSK